MPSSDWLRYSRSILWVSGVAAGAEGVFFFFSSVCEEDYDEGFERLVDLY